jgi:hypothetical protein
MVVGTAAALNGAVTAAAAALPHSALVDSVARAPQGFCRSSKMKRSRQVCARSFRESDELTTGSCQPQDRDCCLREAAVWMGARKHRVDVNGHASARARAHVCTPLAEFHSITCFYFQADACVHMPFGAC